MLKRYETRLPASSQIPLTLPCSIFQSSSGIMLKPGRQTPTGGWMKSDAESDWSFTFPASFIY
jgi:hypothetical protein